MEGNTRLLRDGLREQFKEEAGIKAINDKDFEIDIEYVEWLEDKVIKNNTKKFFKER